MPELSSSVVLQGAVFDYLSLVIAVLTIVQILWGLFAKE
jgi:hypothetical protein